MLLLAPAALFDVAINAEGSALEQRARRKLMSGLHAMFSLGGMAGALLCFLLHRGGVAPQFQLAGSAAAMAIALWASAAGLGSQRTDSEEAPAPIARPRGILLWMGVLTALCMVAEGSMYDWSALFIRQELATDAATGALGFAAFSAAMAIGRLFGDRVRERFTPVALMRGSGVLATAGMALALTTAAPAVALLGFMLAGLGLANVVPVMFAPRRRCRASRRRTAWRRCPSVGYLGFMVGPPLIGALARWSSLTAALWAVALFAVLMGVAARAVLGAAADQSFEFGLGHLDVEALHRVGRIAGGRVGVELLGLLHLLVAFEHHQAVGVLHHRDRRDRVELERGLVHLQALVLLAPWVRPSRVPTLSITSAWKAPARCARRRGAAAA